MPLRESERSKRRQLALDAPLGELRADQMLSFHDWCRLNRFSERTGRRVLSGPNGPRVTMLSERRIGITVGNNRQWMESRER